jgi:ribosome-associated protein
MIPISERSFEKEFVFTAVRSSGPGGQHVNKVSSKVELRWSVRGSELVSVEEREMILEKLSNRINKEGELILSSQEERSQIKNKEKLVRLFYELISIALQKPNKRKKMRVTKAEKEKRLSEKKKTSEKKTRRKPPEEE